MPMPLRAASWCWRATPPLSSPSRASWGRRPRPPLTAMRGAVLGQGQGSRPRLFCYSLPTYRPRSTGHPVGQALLVPTPQVASASPSSCGRARHRSDPRPSTSEASPDVASAPMSVAVDQGEVPASVLLRFREETHTRYSLGEESILSGNFCVLEVSWGATFGKLDRM